jgi:carboxyl-terminal processing protease
VIARRDLEEGKFVYSFLAVLLLAAAFLLQGGQAQTDSASKISLSDRIYVASRVYGTIQSYFNVWSEKDGVEFDQSYRDYLQNILHTEDRKAFDLETMRFVALLRNGHTWFNDTWLQQHYGSPLGFYAEPVQGQWVVTRSDLPQLRLGDVIANIDGKPAEDFFQHNRQFLADSNERSERTDLFAQAYLFPQRFELTLADARKVNITRGGNGDQPGPGEQVNGHWLEPDHFGYIRIPSFSGGVTVESAAIAQLRKFRDSHGLVIDVRGNLGGDGESYDLQLALMERPFRSWRESLGRFNSPRGNQTELISEGGEERRDRGRGSGIFTGPLVILIDGGCASSCENFVMPFKDNHRATLIGETTYGSYSDTYFVTFDNGMMLNTAVTRVSFPDGKPFESIGISPDIRIERTVEDVRSGNDPVLTRAREVLRSPSR